MIQAETAIHGEDFRQAAARPPDAAKRAESNLTAGHDSSAFTIRAGWECEAGRRALLRQLLQYALGESVR